MEYTGDKAISIEPAHEATEPPPVLFENTDGQLPNANFRVVGRALHFKVTQDGSSATALATGDGQLIAEIIPELDGARPIRVRAYVTTVSTAAGPISIQIRNITQAVDILSTAITIDDNELSSKTAATAAVIKTHVFKDGDQIAIDVDTAGTGAKGLGVYIIVQ